VSQERRKSGGALRPSINNSVAGEFFKMHSAPVPKLLVPLHFGVGPLDFISKFIQELAK
jgi:hypothetical protein